MVGLELHQIQNEHNFYKIRINEDGKPRHLCNPACDLHSTRADLRRGTMCEMAPRFKGISTASGFLGYMCYESALYDVSLMLLVGRPATGSFARSALA